MPKVINLPPAGTPPQPDPVYKVGQSLWFLMDAEDPASLRSGVVTKVGENLLEIKSGNDIIELVMGADVIYTEPPANVAAPHPVAPPVAQTPVSGGQVVGIGDTAQVGNGVKFRTSVGIETGQVQDIDGKNGDLWVLKPGNQKRTRVPRNTVVEVTASSQIAANVAPPPVEAAPEVVTPTVVLPPVAAPVVPPTAAPMKVAELPRDPQQDYKPAVRQAGVVERVKYDNMVGDVFDDPRLLELPRLVIAQGVKDHELLELKKGCLYIGSGADPSGYVAIATSDCKVGSRTMPGVRFVVVEMRGYWMEQVPYLKEKKDGTMPIICHTPEELKAAASRAEFEFAPEARFVLMICKPDGVESDYFRYPIGGQLWAMVAFKAARTAFNAFVTPINTRVKLGGKDPGSWNFVLHSELVEGTNIFGKPIVVCKGELDAETNAAIRDFAPKK